MKRGFVAAMSMVCLLTVVLAGAAAQASLGGRLSDLAPFLDKMVENHYNPLLNAGFGSFTYKDTQLPTPFARWFEDEIRGAAAGSKHIKLFDKRVAAAMDPSLRKGYEEFLSTGQVDSLVYGTYVVDGDFVAVRLAFTDLGTGHLIAQADYKVPQKVVPPYAAVVPSVKTVQTATSLANVAGGKSVDPSFTLSLSTDRGAGATFRDGELLTLLFSSSKDAYLKIYHVDANGVAQLIWPNKFGGSGRVKAGETMSFPKPGDAFKFKISPPYGTEYIKAIASTVPFATQEPDFSDLSGDAAQAITRGISVVSSAAFTRAEALVVYEVLPVDP
jgi:hypothetical protein